MFVPRENAVNPVFFACYLSERVVKYGNDNSFAAILNSETLKNRLKPMKKTMERVWDFLQVAGFVLFFWGMGGGLAFFLLFGEPRGIMDSVIGAALLLDLAVMLVWFLWGIISNRRENREEEEPETAGEPAANAPVRHHVSYFGFLIAAALILMFLGSCFGKEKSPEYRYRIMKSYEEGMKAYAEQDYPAAVESFKFAAEKGHTKARFQLGKCYYEGTGVEKDDAKAVEWLRRASYGDPGATELLERVEREMLARAREERRADE